MKLAARYNKASMILSIVILMVGGIIYFIAISYFSDNQIDRDLKEEVDEVSVYVATHQRLPKPYEFDENAAVFRRIPHPISGLRFTDTPYYEQQSKKMRPGRAVIGMAQLKGVNYQVIITESKESTQYLIQVIGTITIILASLLLTGLFFTNRYILSDLWKPFYDLLKKLKAFEASETFVPVKDQLIVDEFNELRKAIDHMAMRVSKDYQSLKIFTENASHEMMTPLAVITSKLDNLVQDEALNAAQLEQLQDIYMASGKLSRLNQSLLLLVKIDNHLINEVSTIDLKRTIEVKLDEFQEVIRKKEIVISEFIREKSIVANVYLVDMLFNNLISNAIRHNIQGGQLRLELNSDQFIIANTGMSEMLDEGLIFERFQKSRFSEGLGLGLTIARNICDNYGLRLTYTFHEGFHRFCIAFI